MVKIMAECWNTNKDKLRDVLANRTDLSECDYELLAKLTYETIFNDHEGVMDYEKLDLENISIIDNGDYQGTLIILVPFNTYQPSEYEYLMSYIGYGSCCGCDVLQAAQLYSDDGEKLNETQLSDFMSICEDIVSNTIKPYNYGWRESKAYLPVEETAK